MKKCACCVVLLTVSHLKQLFCLLCAKDGSPASTCSSSPKLDWMIKRGMVGLSPNYVLVLHRVTFHCPRFLVFCEVALPFWCALGWFWWNCFVDRLVLCMLFKTIHFCLFVLLFHFCACTHRTCRWWGCTLLECHIVAIFIFAWSPTFSHLNGYNIFLSFPRCNVCSCTDHPPFIFLDSPCPVHCYGWHWEVASAGWWGKSILLLVLNTRKEIYELSFSFDLFMDNIGSFWVPLVCLSSGARQFQKVG